jgi:hypothetical protein
MPLIKRKKAHQKQQLREPRCRRCGHECQCTEEETDAGGPA